MKDDLAKNLNQENAENLRQITAHLCEQQLKIFPDLYNIIWEKQVLAILKLKTTIQNNEQGTISLTLN